MHKNTLWTNDNLFVLTGMNSESVDLIYLDPPFNSKRTYAAPIGSKAAGASFDDMWTWDDVNEAYLEGLVSKDPSLVQYLLSIGSVHGKAMMAYLTFMTQRLIEMHRVLKSTGSVYLHCDPTASHYLKIIMDYTFGKSNFRNEIVWWYRKFGQGRKNFKKNHDIILYYCKDQKQACFNELYENFSPKTQKDKFKRVLVDGRWVQDKNIPMEHIRKHDGVSMSNTWEISFLNSQSKERTGYPTQKPLELLHRIIKASSNEGDIVLDPFCGCATTCVAAQRLERKWIGIDIEKKARDLVVERLSNDTIFSDFVHRTDAPQRTDVKVEPPSKSIKEKLFEKQEGKCEGCLTEMRIVDFHIDHIVPKSKGGGDYFENYQLLCSNCNRVKGDRPMEYLRQKIAKRQEVFARNSFGL